MNSNPRSWILASVCYFTLGFLQPNSATVNWQDSGQDSGQGWEQGSGTNWIESLPTELRASVLWYADHETGNLHQWSIPDAEHPGGGVLNTGAELVTAKATQAVVHSGKFAAEATIRDAFRANGDKAVRLMRWTTDAYDRGGKELPLEAYYSTWMFLPEAYDPTKHAPWDPGDGGWWNVFQFKSHDEQDISQPIWSLNVAKNPNNGILTFYLYSQINRQKSWQQKNPVPIPIGRWFHLEAFYLAKAAETGEIRIWLDGQLILEATEVRTSVNPNRENVVWGIGNYTNHIMGGPEKGTATIYFDDSLISTRPIAPFVRQMLSK